MSQDVVTVLSECETVIERGLSTFVEVGQALARIRAERLYQETHGTFEDYCGERWGMTKTHANHLVAGSETATIVAKAKLPAPATEGVARELAPLRKAPEVLQKAWSEATSESQRPTAKRVKEIVRQLKPPARPKRAKPKNTESDLAAHHLPDVVADDAGSNLRTQAVHWFEQGRRVQRLLDDGGEVKLRSKDDRAALRRDAELMARIARRLKEATRNAE